MSDLTALLRTHGVDVAMALLLGLSIGVGLLRGLVFEVLSIVGWAVAWLAARWGTPLVGPHLGFGAPGSAVNAVAAFVVVFAVTLLVWALGVRLVRALIRATPLSPLDRLLGAVFGMLRGALVLLAVAAVVGLTPLRDADAWQRSVGALWLRGTLHELKPMLPPDVSRRLSA